jgi:predicted phosphohydrolase
MKFLNLIVLLLFLSIISCSKDKKIRFAVCTDVHQDIIYDAPDRIKSFVKEAKNRKVDFIIQLGDFCFPINENKAFIDIWNSFPGEKYHVLGNHDMDRSSKQETMNFWGMKRPYYSFDKGAFHFIVLDPNFILLKDTYIDYENGNYFAHPKTKAIIPPDQVEWLKRDLSKTNKLVVVFSHQQLIGHGGVRNKEEIRKILEDANISKQKVIACFNGHRHDDNHKVINGIHYIEINSMSYKWVGEKNARKERFSEEINAFRPELKNTIPYAKAIYGIVEIDPAGSLTIKGKHGEFIPPGPEELGIKEESRQSPSISDRHLKF